MEQFEGHFKSVGTDVGARLSVSLGSTPDNPRLIVLLPNGAVNEGILCGAVASFDKCLYGTAETDIRDGMIKIEYSDFGSNCPLEDKQLGTDYIR